MSYYDFHSQRLFDQYNAISAEQVHACWLHLLNSNAGNVCDIGAGAGRDADWLQGNTARHADVRVPRSTGELLDSAYS